MTDPGLSQSDLDDALAAEYVLGVLDGDERAEAETRIRHEPEFADRVAAWENRMAGLNADFAEVPAPDLMPAIEARLFPTPARRGWFARSFGWVSGAATAAVLTMLVIAVFDPPRPTLVARLAAADNRLAYDVAEIGDRLQITRVAGKPAAGGLVHELWLIAPGEGPVSLGLLENGPLVVDQPAPAAGSVLAVSLEPAGGSTLGVPTGPVILSVEVGI